MFEIKETSFRAAVLSIETHLHTLVKTNRHHALSDIEQAAHKLLLADFVRAALDLRQVYLAARERNQTLPPYETVATLEVVLLEEQPPKGRK